MTKLAVIGGSGFYQLGIMEAPKEAIVETPYGEPSGKYLTGHIKNQPFVFLARHGEHHRIPPHKINYRANMWGLKQLEVETVIAIAAVGGITPEMKPGHIVIPDQIIDYSYGREHSYFSDDLDSVTHIDFSYPYHPASREKLIALLSELTMDFSHSATYGCTQGPRLETSAEIIRMEKDGCHIVGMTGMPEAALAKELGMNYIAIAVVANWAAGKSEFEISMEEIERNLKQGMINVSEVIAAISDAKLFS